MGDRISIKSTSSRESQMHQTQTTNDKLTLRLSSPPAISPAKTCNALCPRAGCYQLPLFLKALRLPSMPAHLLLTPSHSRSQVHTRSAKRRHSHSRASSKQSLPSPPVKASGILHQYSLGHGALSIPLVIHETSFLDALCARQNFWMSAWLTR